MNEIQKVADYLEKTGIFYMTTVNGMQPKCRPVGLFLLKDDVLYFGVGTFKEVYRQLVENPYVEICACQGSSWLRYYGKAVFEKDDVIAKIALEKNASLQSIYNEETGNILGMFHLEEATAEFRGVLDVKEKITF